MVRIMCSLIGNLKLFNYTFTIHYICVGFLPAISLSTPKKVMLIMVLYTWS